MAEAEGTPSAALQPCGLCGESRAKYKCPGCLVRTCSLACSRGHKEKADCSGQRDRTGFVRQADYDANTMMSDYGLLQELARDHALLRRDAEQHGIAATGQRARAAQAPSRDSMDEPPAVQLNRAQRTTVACAKEKRQVTIRYMSPGIKRHQLNRTIWQSSSSRLVWTIEVVVPESEANPNRWIESGFHDVCRLGDLWSRLLQAQPGAPEPPVDRSSAEAPRKRIKTDAIRVRLPSDDGNEYQFRSSIRPELLSEIVQMFGGTPPEELVWLIRVQDKPANRPTFCRVDPLRPLFTQLFYQTVIEFPTIYVFKQAPSTWDNYETTIEDPCTAESECVLDARAEAEDRTDEACASVVGPGPATSPQTTHGDIASE
ncbi:Box C/D snoRNA accumulation [Coemansia biformis]|uniref:Box C/D snoRNA protein 1 n=1 Tax=Coemansia biformis TaxID=1286918 RepID=A0A9W8CWV7_9FUNG|nr:Box C/D snoRNA accumulation [Coemansia biformis]